MTNKPTISAITASYITKAQALNDGVPFDNLDDRNSTFFNQEKIFSEDLKNTADYIEYSLDVVAGYTDTKLYFDEMLNDGNYLNDLAAYETRILDYHNEQYSTNETVISDEILNNLSAKEMESLTVELTNAVVYSEHNTQLIEYYNEFRGERTNAEVYADIVAYLQPLQQGISRILASAAVQVFVEGSDAYNDLVTYTTNLKDEMIDDINEQINYTTKITEANTAYENLSNINTNATATIESMNSANTTLLSTIEDADNSNVALTGKINIADTLNTDLTSAISNGNATLSNLNTAITNGDLANKVNVSDIVDELTSIDTSKPLSAKQGKVLKELIDNVFTILSSDDIALDELQEIVNFIKQNKSTLDALGISNIAGLVDALAAKQDTLQSGVNVKTVGGQSILGAGDIVISGGIGEYKNTSNIAISNDGSALSSATTITDTIALGRNAGSIANFYNANIFIGLNSGKNTKGQLSVLIGENAGQYASKAIYDGRCTALGAFALGGQSGNYFPYCTAVGAYSQAKEHSNSSGYGHNTSIGYLSLNYTSGKYNTAIGAKALVINNGSTVLSYDNVTGLGYDAQVTASNQVQLGNSSTTTYAYGAVQDRSDERDKADIVDTDLGLDFINMIRPVKYKWNYREDYYEEIKVEKTRTVLDKDGKEVEETYTEIVKVPIENDGSKKRKRSHQGVIAQEVKEVMESLGVDFGGYQDHSLNGGNDVKSIGYQEFIPPLIKAVQELAAKNADLEKRLSALEG